MYVVVQRVIFSACVHVSYAVTHTVTLYVSSNFTRIASELAPLTKNGHHAHSPSFTYVFVHHCMVCAYLLPLAWLEESYLIGFRKRDTLLKEVM